MSIDAKSAARPAGTAAPAGLARVRRGSLAVLVLVTSSGHPADSMAMSVFTGVGLLCYAANLYLLPPRGRRA